MLTEWPINNASASKSHTLVLTKNAEVWTFGYSKVTPQRVFFGAAAHPTRTRTTDGASSSVTTRESSEN